MARAKKYVAFRPAEDATVLADPAQTGLVHHPTGRQQLTSHLYKPGPRHRRVTAEPTVDAWYHRVAQDIQLKRPDAAGRPLATPARALRDRRLSHGPAGPRADQLSPVPRQDFVFWASPDDPRVATAVCTITCVGPDTTRYRVWTASH